MAAATIVRRKPWKGNQMKRVERCRLELLTRDQHWLVQRGGASKFISNQSQEILAKIEERFSLLSNLLNDQATTHDIDRRSTC